MSFSIGVFLLMFLFINKGETNQLHRDKVKLPVHKMLPMHNINKLENRIIMLTDFCP